MPSLPAALEGVLLPFAPVCSPRIWKRAQVLLVGALLSPGRRTVAQALRVMGLGAERHFPSYHRVLSRATWSCREIARILLRLLVRRFVPEGPLVFGLDDTIERRWGPKIKARGIYRDPVRSSRGHFVKASGLRWLTLALLTPVPWAGRVWALPEDSAAVERVRKTRAHPPLPTCVLLGLPRPGGAHYPSKGIDESQVGLKAGHMTTRVVAVASGSAYDVYDVVAAPKVEGRGWKIVKVVHLDFVRS